MVGPLNHSLLQAKEIQGFQKSTLDLESYCQAPSRSKAIFSAWVKRWQNEDMTEREMLPLMFGLVLILCPEFSIMPDFLILWTSNWPISSRTRISPPYHLFCLAPVLCYWNSLMATIHFPSSAYSWVLCCITSSGILWPPCEEPVKSTTTDFLDTHVSFYSLPPCWVWPHSLSHWLQFLCSTTLELTQHIQRSCLKV